MYFRFYKIALAVLIFGYAPVLNAQEGDLGSLDSFAFSIDLNEYVITAQHKPTHYKKALYKIEVLDSKTLEARGVVKLDEALQLLPSVKLERDNILGTSISVNGMSGNNVAILIDGVPVIGRQGGFVDISQIFLQDIERIEMIKGPMSNYYGNNAAGGVINIITKQSHLNKFACAVGGQIESNGDHSLNSSISYRLKKLDFSVKAGLFEYQKYPADSLRILDVFENEDGIEYSRNRYPWNPKNQHFYGGSARIQLNNENKIVLKSEHTQEVLQDFGPVKRPQYKPYAYDDEFATLRTDYSLKYDGILIQNLFVDLSLARNWYARFSENNRFEFEEEQYNSTFQNIDTSIFLLHFGRLNFSYDFNDQWNVSLGYNISQEYNAGDRILDTTQTIESSAQFIEQAAYLEGKFNPNQKMSFGASGRYIHHSVYDQHFTPAFNFKYQFSEKFLWRVSVAQGYRSPSLKELHLNFVDINHNITGNSNLLPEVSTNYQSNLGIQWNKALFFDVNVFKTYLKNQIILAQVDELVYEYQNLNSFDVHGIELSGSYRKKGFYTQNSINGLFSSTNMEGVDAPDYISTINVSSQVSYTLQKLNVSANLYYRIIGSEPKFLLDGDELIQSIYSPQHFLDFTMQKTWGKRYKVQLIGGINNILNQKRISIINNANSNSIQSINISRGRNFFIGVKTSL